MMKLVVLDENNSSQPFPPLRNALCEPNGLLAIGGCLSSERLINAYRQGVFPWFSGNEPILWWSPNPRLVLFPAKLHISKRLAKTLRQKKFDVTTNQAFDLVISKCAELRVNAEGTWISADIQRAYSKLHREGFAHSFEAWHDGELVGGLYGVALGNVFFGESMFCTRSDASKVAFTYCVHYLQSLDFQLIDCQVRSEHLVGLGAQEISRTDFSRLLKIYCSVY
ncbi:leucyl/phenylalanyl-tRNA--protein transferase [Methylococcaceae bacterium]|nr:leucyl/phenylalanyl-tRNA--protein transferase [Methylococcaceae bacterium]